MKHNEPTLNIIHNTCIKSQKTNHRLQTILPSKIAHVEILQMYSWKVPGSISPGTPAVLSEVIVVYLCFYRHMLGWYCIYTMVASFKIHSISSLTDSNTNDMLVFIMYILNLVFFRTG